MVAIVSGNSLGLSLTSLGILGGRGAFGSATTGRNGELAYVNAATGNLVLRDLDDSLLGHGGALQSVRTYNSRGLFSDDNGDNWSVGIAGQRLELTNALDMPGSTVIRTDRDGAQATYLYDATQALYVSTDGSGAYDTVALDASTGDWIWTDGATGAQENYGATGDRLLSTRDAAGNVANFDYNLDGLVASATDASGETVYYDYTGTQLTQIRTVLPNDGDPLTVTRVQYGYDSLGRLSTVTVDLTPADNSVTDGQTYQTAYTYDGSSTRVASVTQSDGTSLTFTYVDVGGDYRVADVQDALGNLTHFDYDLSAGRTTLTDPLGLITLYDYDAQGQLLQVTAPAVGGTSSTTAFAYDADGDVTSVTDALGHAVVYQYDERGNQTLQRDALGNTVTRTFGDRNQVLTQTLYALPDPDGDGTETAAAPMTSRFVYDAAGQHELLFAISAEGRVTEYRYNSFGERTATIQYAAAEFDTSAWGPTQTPTALDMADWTTSQDLSRTMRTDFAYDFRGQLRTSTAYAAVDASGAGVADATAVATTWVYDQAGLLISTQASNADATHWTYDGLGRVLSKADALGAITLTQYDDANNKTLVTLANQLVTTNHFDAAGRLVSVTQSGPGNSLLGETKYSYDADGRLVMTEAPTGVHAWALYDDAGRKVADIDAQGSLTEYLYNADGQPTQTIRYATAVDTASLLATDGSPSMPSLASILPAASSADQIGWALHDDAGRLAWQVDALGHVTHTVYDGASRVTSVTRYTTPIDPTLLGDGTAAQLFLASDPSAGSGPLVQLVQPDPVTDRTEHRVYDRDGLLRVVVDAESFATEYRYDAAGQQVGTVRHALRIVHPYADISPPPAEDAGLVADAVELARTTGDLQPLLEPLGFDDVYTFTYYNARGQVAGQIDGNGFLTEYVYDERGNLSQAIRYATQASSVTYPRQYFDWAASTLASVRPDSSSQDRVQTSTWSETNQLLSQTNAEGTLTTYTYDSVGLLVSSTTAKDTDDQRTLTHRYDLQGRLTGELSGEGSAQLTGNQTQAEIDAVWASYGIRYDYDSAGRRSGMVDANGHQTLYFYDADSRLTQTVNALGEVQERHYNALGQLDRTTDYGTRIDTSSLTGSHAGGLDDGTLASLLDGVRSSATDRTTALFYDAAGELTSSNDALGYVTRYTYNAFGEVTATDRPTDASHWTRSFAILDRRGIASFTSSSSADDPGTRHAFIDGLGREGYTELTHAWNPDHYVSRSFDANGQLTGIYEFGNGYSTGLTRSSNTSYDAFGRTVSQTDAMGQTTTYSYDDAARSVTVVTPEGLTLTTVHNREGQVQSITDGLGNTTQYVYDRDGLLVQTVAPAGADTPGTPTTTANHYDHAGLLLDSTDANCNKVVYTYDAANRLLTRSVDPEGLDITTTYGYDALGRQVSFTDANGNTTTTDFDLDNNALTVNRPGGWPTIPTHAAYDAQGRVLTVETQGEVTTYAYDSLGRKISQTVDPGTGAASLVQQWTYDGQGNCTSFTDTTGHVTRYVYDTLDRLTYTIDATGGVTQTLYDAAGHVSATRAFATRLDSGAVVAFADTSVPVATWDVEPLLQASASDVSETRLYDHDGRVRFSVSGDGSVVQYVYQDQTNNLVERHAYANRIDVASWDGVSDPTPVEDLSRDERVRTVYDALNRPIYSVDGTGAVVEQHFDGNGNVIDRTAYAHAIDPATSADAASISEALTALTVAYPGAPDARVHNHFDAANRVDLTVDGTGAVTRFAYDDMGHVVQQVRYATQLATPIAADADLPTLAAALPLSDADRVTEWTFDATGRVAFRLQLVDRDASGTAQWAVTSYVYDTVGRVARVRDYAALLSDTALRRTDFLYEEVAATPGQDRSTYYGYDIAGRLSIRIDADGAVTEMSYDDAGNATTTRLAARVDTSGFDSEPFFSSQQTGYSWAFGSTLLSYASPNPALDRSSTTVLDAAGRVAYVVDALGHVVYSEYDGVGRIVRTTRYAQAIDRAALGDLTFDSVRDAVAAADLNPNADEVSSETYDSGNRLASSTDALLGVEHFAYDGLGRKTSFTNEKDSVWTYDYDAAGRLISETSPEVAVAQGTLTAGAGADGGPAAAYVSSMAAIVTHLDYDALGNLVQRTEAVGLAEERTTRYAYDAAGHQVSVAYPRVSVYAETGAGLAANGQSGLATRSETARDGSSSSHASLGTRTLYNAFGEAIGNVDVAGGVSYKAYDNAGRVVGEVDALGYVTEYGHDAFGDTTTISRHSAATTLTAAAPTSVTSAPSLAAIDAALSAVAAADTQTRVVTNSYDTMGRVVRTTEPVVFAFNAATGSNSSTAGKTTQKDYDAFGEVVKTRQLSDVSVGNVQSWSDTYEYYDLLGRHVGTIDALGYLTTRAYDAFGNLVRTTEFANALAAPSGTGDHTPSAITWSTGTDIAATGVTTSLDDRTTINVYDLLNRLVAETRVGVETATIVGGVATGANSRVDVTTSYGYDAVGNRTRTTDANNASTYSLYDALGRVTAVIAPTRATGGGTLAPLTTFERDAYGNLVVKTDHANGAVGPAEFVGVSTLSDPGYAVVADPGADRSTVSVYDLDGHVTQMTDAQGATHYSSYNERGQLAKTWQMVSHTEADGTLVKQTQFEAYKYDKLGRLIDVVDPAPATKLVNGNIVTFPQATVYLTDNTMAYNAFGEIVSKGVYGQQQEYFEYDNAGQLWRTNSGDGIDKVYLYDLQGRRTSQIVSEGSGGSDLDLKATFSNAQDVAMRADTRRTDTKYDALGHVTEQVEAARVTGTTGTTLTSRTGTLSSSILQTNVYAGSSTPGWTNVPNVVNLSWTTLAGLGGGDVRVQVDYVSQTYSYWQRGIDDMEEITHPGVTLSVTQTFTANQAGQGATLSWNDGVLAPNGGIVSISHITVYKKDAAGNWQQVISQAGAGSTGSTLEVATVPNTTLQLQYKASGSSTWLNATGLVDFGDAWRFDSSALANGNYDFQATYIPYGQTQGLGLAGSFVVGGSGSSTISSPIVERPKFQQTTDRWGNVTEVTDPRMNLWTTRYTYNYANQLMTVAQPNSVGVHDGSSPFTKIFYDARGRQVAVLDANGHLNGQQYDAGGNLVAETHADGGKVTYGYDAFGEKVSMLDAVGNAIVTSGHAFEIAQHSVQYTYDKLGHLLNTQHGAAFMVAGVNQYNHTLLAPQWQMLVESNVYDEAGRLLSRTNAEGQITSYTYDLAGHIIATRQPLGDTMRDAYDALGRKVAEVDAESKVTKWSYDYFGRMTTGAGAGHTDMGGASYTYVYDHAGQLTRVTNSRGQDISYSYDKAGQQIQATTLISAANGSSPAIWNTATTAYDKAGNHIAEKTAQSTNIGTDASPIWVDAIYQNNQLAYDSLNRLRVVTDGSVQVKFEYDAVGNRTHINTHAFNGDAGVESDRWFRYDAMNRQTLVDGTKDDIHTGTDVDHINATQGHALAYDLNGNRISDIHYGVHVTTTGGTQELTGYTVYRLDESGNHVAVTGDGGTPALFAATDFAVDEFNGKTYIISLTNNTPGDGGGGRFYIDGRDAEYTTTALHYEKGNGKVTETYTYDGLDRLTSTTRDGVVIDMRQYDAASRVVSQGPQGLASQYTGTLNDGVPLDEQEGLEQRVNEYDDDGRLHYQSIYNSDGTPKAHTFFSHYDAAGNLKSWTTTQQDQAGINYTNSLGYYEGAVQSSTTGTSGAFDPGTSTQNYDVNGRLISYSDSTLANNNRQFVNDAQGQALMVTQAGNLLRQFIVNGEVMGRYGVTMDGVKPRDDQGNPRFSPVNGTGAEFEFGYAPISASYPAASSGTYRVSPGDTLQSIAQGAYGDSSLWYRIAQANGLQSSTDIRVGQTLTIPTASSAKNNAQTYAPYDPSKVVGDTTPNMPAPNNGSDCGGLGQILVIVVALVVTYFTAGAAAGWLASAAPGVFAGSAVTVGGVGLSVTGAVAAGAIGAAAGSIVSQGVGVATGLQKDFNWNQVALSAIGGGISGGLAGYAGGATSLAEEGLKNTFVRAAVSNAISQGIGVATGLQKGFDWRGAAVAAVGAGVGQAVGDQIGGALSGLGDFGGDVARRFVSGVVAGAAVNVLRGGRVTAQQVATDAFGNALGESLAEAASSTEYSEAAMSAQEDMRDAAMAQAVNGYAPPSASNNNGYSPSRSVEEGRTFSDVFGPVTSFDPTASQDVVLPMAVVRPNSMDWVDGQRVPNGAGVFPVDEGSSAGAQAGAGRTNDVGGLQMLESQAAQSTKYISTDGGLYDTPQAPVVITGHRMTADEAAAYDAEQARAQLQQTTDAQVIAGTYNKFSAALGAASSGNWSQAFFHLNYQASDAAQAAVHDRMYPPVSAATRKFQNDIGIAAGGPVFTGLASVARHYGAPEDVVENFAIAQTGVVSSLAAVAGGAGSVSLRPVGNTSSLAVGETQPLLTLSRLPGTVVRNALTDTEFAQAQDLATFRGGQFLGAPTENFPGIDGWLDGVPIQMKTVTGNGEQAILRNIVKGAGNMSAQGYVGDIAIDATQTGATVDSFANFVKPGTPVGRILNEGSVNNAYIKLADGWLNITQGTLVVPGK